MKRDWGLVILAMIFIAVAIIGSATQTIAICKTVFHTEKNGPATIKIRYFDGSLDTIRAEEYEIRDGAVFFTSDRGWKTVTGINNAIIIEGDNDDE